MPQYRRSPFLRALRGSTPIGIPALFILSALLAVPLWGQQKSEYGIRHSVVISGPKTFEFDEKDAIVWEYDDRSKDISKLANGNYLAPHRIMPFVKEYDKTGKVLHVFRVDLPELGGPEAKNGTFAAARLVKSFGDSHHCRELGTFSAFSRPELAARILTVPHAFKTSLREVPCLIDVLRQD